MKDRITSESLGPIVVVCESGSLDVGDAASGAADGAGIIPAGSMSTPWIPAQELTPGNPHFVQGGGAASSIFYPLVRYGSPSSSPSMRTQQGLLDPNKAFLGSGDLIVGTLLSQLSPLPVVDEVLPAALWIALRNVDGTDPVVFAGEQALLEAPLIGLGFTVTAHQGNRTAAAGYTLPIPTDPALVGSVLLLQLGFERLGDVVITDVFGTTLRDAPPSGLMRSAGRRPGSTRWVDRESSERAAIRSAAAHWLASLRSSASEGARRMHEASRSR